MSRHVSNLQEFARNHVDLGDKTSSPINKTSSKHAKTTMKMMGLQRAAATFLLLSLLRTGRTTAFTATTNSLTSATYAIRHSYATTTTLTAKPKRGHVVDSYQTVSVNCAKCSFRLFRYKKKNGTKSNLVKCFVERIAQDCGGILPPEGEFLGDAADTVYCCPSCETAFARPTLIRGMPALKLVGGKTRMTKK